MKKKGRKDKLKNRSKQRKHLIEETKTQEKPTEEDCGVSDETLTRMKHQLSERFGDNHDVIRDSSLEKMSDILLEYGEPFMETIDTDDKAEHEKAIMLSMMLWNFSIMQDSGHKDRKKIEKMLKPLMPDAESKSVVKYMLERKRQMFPDNKRMIMNYELSETPDGFHLSVASTVSKAVAEKYTKSSRNET